MDLARATRHLRRRWPLLVGLLALTVLAVLRVGAGVNHEYAASATAVVVSAPGHYYGPEPYGSVQHTTDVLRVILDSPTTRARVARDGLTPTYTVTGRDRHTTFSITARSPDPELSLATTARVLEIAAQELTTRQEAAEVPVASRYGVHVLSEPTLPHTAPWRTRNMVLVALLGTLAALTLTLRVPWPPARGVTGRPVSP